MAADLLGRRRASRPFAPASAFARRVIAAVRRIPRGRVATYGDIAEIAGSPRAWRAVGSIMRECRDPSVPCHRVIASGGTLGGYTDLQLKRELLRAEGHAVTRTRLRDFESVRWQPHSTRNQPSGSRNRRSSDVDHP